MKPLTRMFASLAVVTVMGLPALTAAEKKAKFSDWDLGKVAFGEKISKKDVAGKVVVLEYWGVNCPPCVASLPHLAEMDRKHRAEGLVIIGAECQMSTKEQMKPLLEKAKVDYTIVESAEGPIEVTGIPRVFVFGTDGTLVFDGSPSGEGFDKAVKDALASTDKDIAKADNKPAGNLIESREWTNATGGSIRAALKSADATKASFLMPTGKVVDYPLDKLSEESRKVIEEALKKTAATP